MRTSHCIPHYHARNDHYKSKNFHSFSPSLPHERIRPPSTYPLYPRMTRFFVLALLISLPAHAAPDFASVVPALNATCIDCHSAKKTKGGVNLEPLLGDPQVEKEYALWEKVRQVVEAGEMPPADADELLPTEKDHLIAWVDAALTEVANRNAGDPGPVTLRRLTNFEYDNTLRDLTGIDLQLSKEFAPDGGGGEGFSNIGDVLFISPQQLDKYLSAARIIADHATVLPGSGISFHPQRIGLRGAKQIKDQSEQALYVWYQKAATPLLPKDGEDFREDAYMLACWKWKHKDLTGAQSLAQLATDSNLILPFLENWWTMLNNTKLESRFLDLTRTPWHHLPPPATDRPTEVPPAVTTTLAAIKAQRRSWLGEKDPGSGVQRRQQDADGLRPYPVRTAIPPNTTQVHLVVGDLGDGKVGDNVHFSKFSVKIQNKGQSYLAAVQAHLKVLHTSLTAPKTTPLEPANRKAVEQAIVTFNQALTLFPKGPDGQPSDATPLFLPAPQVLTLPLPPGTTEFSAVGQLDLSHPDADHASVQWTLTTSLPPDPTAIIPGVLTLWKRQTETSRQVMNDFNRMKSAFPDVMERRLEEVANNLNRNGQSGIGVYYFNDTQLTHVLPESEKRRLLEMREDWAYTSPTRLNPQQQTEYHQRLRNHLHHFADRAWRRPTSPEEKTQLSALYDAGLAAELAPESAAREAIVRILVSPHFLYKTETLPLATAPASAPGNAAPAEVKLDAHQIAARLSYFLWASTPDWPLRQAAANDSLLQPEIRKAHVLRMLKDPRANALAREFAGQWLEFAGFAENTTMDAEKFPEFTPTLRDAMNRETQLFFENLIRQDRSALDIILADYTYLNEPLARHYGVPEVVGPEFRQVSVKGLPRGGLLGMGSVLAKTSRPHRTSPVLRGNWLLNAILGTPVPPPPNNVPELQEHPEKPASLRAQLEQHRDDPACAACHNRIDPLGFALERFDPIGRLRQNDDLGHPIDTSASLTDGTQFDGFGGLRDYLATRQSPFTKLFSRKLLAYALGRSIQPTDTALISAMQKQLSENQNRFSSAVLAVVESRQFLQRRVD
jgi:mono/diheme cytochrome c family protein